MFPNPLTENIEYYTSHSLMSSPGAYAYLYDDLPDEPAALIKILQGVLIHELVADYYQVQVSSVQRAEQHLRSIEQRLQRLAELDPAPLSVPRPPVERQVGVCRDFALFLSPCSGTRAYQPACGWVLLPIWFPAPPNRWLGLRLVLPESSLRIY